MGALIGLGAHFLVFRPLRNAAPLGKVIGSVGVVLYLQGVAQMNFGRAAAAEVRVPHPGQAVQELPQPGQAVPRNRLCAVIALVSSAP